MDYSTLQLVEQVVLEKAQAGEMFTAYDVTKEVRKRVGRSVNVPHNEVKQEVHNFFANDQMGTDYTRTLGNIPGLQSQPWVYHHTANDPANYGAPSVVPQLPPVSPGSVPDDAVNQTPQGTYKVDARDTLCVPKSLLVAAGLNPGEEAYVSADALAGHVVVSKSPPDGTVLTSLSTYTVDKYGNVRITQHTLANGGIGGKEFTIDGDANRVYVKKAV
jgi:hypothetical protein